MITVVKAQQATPSMKAEGTFTGEVWRDTLIPRQDGIGMANVFFTPGARTYWHAHHGGQLLTIVAGAGFVGDDDGALAVTVGDVIWTPPGVRHWHGAAPDRFMVHTALSVAGVDWMEAVSDETYPSAP